MNRRIPAIVLFLFSFGVVIAQQPAELTTLDGKTYSGVKVVRVEKGQAILSHSGGIASVDLSNLPEAFRVANGLLPGFEETKATFREAVTNWIAGYTKLNGQYDGALQTLEQKLESEGKTEMAEAVRSERGSFRKVMSTDVSSVEELAKLQTSYRAFKEKWEAENSSRIVTITDAYLRELKEVVNRLTKDGKIDEAVMAKEEIAKFEGVSGDSDRIQMLLGIGPAIVRIEASVTDLSPDGNPAEKDSGVMAVMTAGQKMDVVLPLGDQFVDVVEMEGNWETWAALKEDGKLISSPLKGEGIPEDHKPVVWFRVGSGVVVAFHPDGSHTVYGDPADPEDRPPEDLSQITQFELDRGSGIALDSEGKVRVWGAMYPSDSARDAVENQFEAVRFVGACENLGWAVEKSGDVYSWRNGGEPQLLGHHEGIAQFGGGRSAYLVLLEDGTLDGGSMGGGESPVVHVPETMRSGKSIRVDGWGYALQFEGGSWHTWGGPPESSSLHSTARGSGALLDLEISAAPDRFLIMMLRKS